MNIMKLIHFLNSSYKFMFSLIICHQLSVSVKISRGSVWNVFSFRKLNVVYITVRCTDINVRQKSFVPWETGKLGEYIKNTLICFHDK